MKRSMFFLLVVSLLALGQQKVSAQAPIVTVHHELIVPEIKLVFKVIMYSTPGNLTIRKVRRVGDTIIIKKISLFLKQEEGDIVLGLDTILKQPIIFMAQDGIGKKGGWISEITFNNIANLLRQSNEEFVVERTTDFLGRTINESALERVNGLVVQWGHYKRFPDNFTWQKKVILSN